MTRARDVSRLITTPPSIYQTDTESSSAGYLSQSSASSTYLTQTSASTTYQGAPYRNLIINGAMNIAQRSTSVNNIFGSNTYFTADRWNTHQPTAINYTQTIDSDSPSGQGFYKSLSTTCISPPQQGSSFDTVYIEQRIEEYNLLRLKYGTNNAENLSLSFWVKSNVTGTFIVGLYDYINYKYIARTYTINSSATWEKKTITFPGNTIDLFNHTTNNGMGIRFWLYAGSDFQNGSLITSWTLNYGQGGGMATGQTSIGSSSNQYFKITGIQLEPGSNVTPFEFKSIDIELAQCLRYFEWVGYYTTNWNTATTTARTGVNWLVKKRRSPDITFTSGYNQYGPGGQLSITSISSVTSGTDGALFTFSQSGGLTTNAPSTANIALKVDAEL